ncbi:MAG: tol-pal system-associated acyl-CoA thioesterase [Gammaproteobacteria bacterium]
MHEWHEWPVRVYYEDTDAEGVVYFANYLKFMERGRTEWLRLHGIEQDVLRREEDLCFVVTETDLRFRRPAQFNDQLVVRTRLTQCGHARFELDQNVHRLADPKALVTSRCVAACVSADEFKPRRMPARLRSALSRDKK